jgi:hypothetical protein
LFFPNSRYLKAGTASVVGPGGRSVLVTRIPVRPVPPVLGDHRRHEGQRLDLLAAHYLGDPTAFWQICDANEAMVPDTLAVGELVHIPRRGP